MDKIRVGDIITTGYNTGIVFEITGESWSKYSPCEGSLHVLTTTKEGIPSRMLFGTGMRYYSFTIYNYPDEMERVEIIGHVDTETLTQYMKERLDEAEQDRNIHQQGQYMSKRVCFKGRGKTERPTCPTCGEDLKRSYEAIKQDSGKWVKIPYGHHCKECKYQIFD